MKEDSLILPSPTVFEGDDVSCPKRHVLLLYLKG